MCIAAGQTLELGYQKFGILHTSGCLMVDMPRLDYLWDGEKDCPGNGQTK